MAEKGTNVFVSVLFCVGSMIPLTIAKETSAGSLVQTNETQVLHNPEGRAARSTLNILSDLTLHLQSNFDDLEGVGEDLTNED